MKRLLPLLLLALLPAVTACRSVLGIGTLSTNARLALTEMNAHSEFLGRTALAGVKGATDPEIRKDGTAAVSDAIVGYKAAYDLYVAELGTPDPLVERRIRNLTNLALLAQGKPTLPEPTPEKP